MKILIDTEDDKALGALADALAAKLLPLFASVVANSDKVVVVAQETADESAPTKPAKPAAAPKATPKPKAADKPAAAPKDGAPTREDVHAALREYSGPKEAADYEDRKNAALKVLHKFSPTLATLPEDKYPDVLAGIKALSAEPADEDPF